MAELASAAGVAGTGTGVRVGHAEGAARRSIGPRVRARRLRLDIDGHDLLHVDELAVDGAGITAIMGANGAGKSLLLRLLHGLVRPSAGRVEHGGEPASIVTRRRQAMLFQSPVLLRRSVLGNLEHVRRARDVEDRCAALLDRVGLAGRERQAARALSGGERQRLALARALLVRPDVLFLDEPTASLDPASTLVVERVLREERAAGTTIVIVTHDPGQARRLADDVVFLHRGRVVERASAAGFFAAPASEAARGYLAGRIVV